MTEFIVKKKRGRSPEQMAELRARRKPKETFQDVTYDVSKTMPGNGSNPYTEILPDPALEPKPIVTFKLPSIPVKYYSIVRSGGLYSLAIITMQDKEIVSHSYSEPDIKAIIVEAFKINVAKDLMQEHSVQHA